MPTAYWTKVYWAIETCEYHVGLFRAKVMTIV
jgi:hypothetical protein